MKHTYLPGLLRYLASAALLFLVQNAFAQSTNPAPYCFPAATAMTDGTCTGNFGFGLSDVRLNGINQGSACYGSSNADVYRYWSATTTLNAGQTYTMVIVTPKSSYNLLVSAGFWIDYDQDSTFDSLELVSSGIARNNTEIKWQFSFTVPCNAKAGVTRMRVRSQANYEVNGSFSCASSSNYGEAWDFDVTIAQPTSVSADFTMPSTAYVKTPVSFINVNRTGYIENRWDANNDGVFDITNMVDFKYVWNTTGTKCMKLRSKNCFGTDSVVKCLSVIAPTAKPDAKFTFCNRSVEQYQSIQIMDESTNGPWKWEWNIIDSTNWYSLATGELYSDPWGTGNNEFSKNPEFAFDVPGSYDVILTATNDVGTSTYVMKNAIKVGPITEYYLGYGTYGNNGDNMVNSNYGSLADDGGVHMNYSNSQGKQTKSFMGLVPQNNTPITLNFQQVKIAAGDTLKIYDNDFANPSDLMAALTSTNNGTYPTFTSTDNRMYLIFQSNSSGTDSGYIASYYTTGYGGTTSRPSEVGHGLLLTNAVSKFYGAYPSLSDDSKYKRWKVDGVLQKTYNGKDTLKYTFTDTTNHTVCLELSDCDTNYTVCKRLAFEKGITGHTYRDVNSNCVLGSGDKNMDNVRIKLLDNSSNLLGQYTSSDGEYSFTVPGNGTYKILVDTARKPYVVGCPYPGVDSVVTLNSTTTYAENIDFPIACRNGFDVGVQSMITRGRVFPGQGHYIRIQAGDLSQWYGLKCAAGKSGSLKVTVTGPVAYTGNINGSRTPSVSGKVFTYSISDFETVKSQSDFGLAFSTDTSAQAGDTIRVDVEVTPTSGDNDTSNNKMTFYYLARNSYDPNMKEVYPIDVPPLYNNWLTYTIHFQNTGNAEAYNIRLADTLSSHLDLSTFEVLDYSHTMSSSLKGNALSFRFPNIMLPDSFTDSKGSQGFVQYRIKPKSNLGEGTKIMNTAFIYFDYNKPVVTNTTVNEYVVNTGIRKLYVNVLNIYPNPANSVFNVEAPSRYKGTPLTVKVYNVLGELVYSSVMTDASARVDLGDNAPGIYTVKVEGADLSLNAVLVKQ